MGLTYLVRRSNNVEYCAVYALSAIDAIKRTFNEDAKELYNNKTYGVYSSSTNIFEVVILAYGNIQLISGLQIRSDVEE
jgi:hypothetical protein